MRFPAKTSETIAITGIREKRNRFIRKNYNILRFRLVINLTIPYASPAMTRPIIA
jgi:hypothetical protein